MSTRRAIILAGGSASEDVDRQIETLGGCGIVDITLVADCEKCSDAHPVRCIHNRFHQHTGTLFSLWLARSVLRFGALIVNGAAVLDSDTLQAFIEVRIPDAVVPARGSHARIELIKVGPEGGRCLTRHVEALISGGATDGCASLAFRSMARRWPLHAVASSTPSLMRLDVAV